MKKILIILLALSLSIIIIGCSNGQTSTTTTIKANGTARNTAKALTTSNSSFASGGYLVNNQDISSQLKPVSPITTTKNNVEFEATVTVNTPKIVLEVQPAPGFVFDEWKLDKNALRRSSLTIEEKRELYRLLDDETEKKESLTIDAKYAEFVKAVFDYGFYVDFSATINGDGTKTAPFNSVAELKTAIENLGEDEITLKIAKTDTAGVDLSFLTTINGLEEVKIIGGFDSSNNWSYNEGDSTLITNLNCSGNLEMEVEHITVDNLTIESETEFEFKDVTIKTKLTAPNKTALGNIKLESGATVSGNNLTFINSVVNNYNAEYTYYHSIIIHDGLVEINGKNNIIISGNENKEYNSNFYLKVGTDVNGFTVNVDSSIKAELKKAIALTEDFFENLTEEIEDLIEDLIEEDIFGFDRDDDQKYVTFGPVEL